jgi:hypothetical protein
VNCNNYPWNVNTNVGVRGACDFYYYAGQIGTVKALPTDFSKKSEDSARSGQYPANIKKDGCRK